MTDAFDILKLSRLSQNVDTERWLLFQFNIFSKKKLQSVKAVCIFVAFQLFTTKRQVRCDEARICFSISNHLISYRSFVHKVLQYIKNKLKTKKIKNKIRSTYASNKTTIKKKNLQEEYKTPGQGWPTFFTSWLIYGSKMLSLPDFLTKIPRWDKKLSKFSTCIHPCIAKIS